STEVEGVNEDIAFAATAIKTQDVHGSSFRYAKVMTLPFFGSGMVEIPPDGYKRMKNSRKMQMVFFVHEGKVTVDIEDVQFGMTKGGVWQVPRAVRDLSSPQICINKQLGKLFMHIQHTPTYVRG
ncbi:hypothetical protein KCU73_g16440, partial [Aureobasidium melanogenum]